MIKIKHKSLKTVLIAISGSALMIGTLFTATLAWFSAANKAALDSGQGFTASSYFAGGNGTANNPYLIDRPIHLYNLAWLQYLGYFNKTESGAYVQTYFKLAADVDMASTSSNNWTLPPIGTTTYPFIGNFDGNGKSVSNLVVDNALGEGHITRKPASVTAEAGLSGVAIVGTFGVVGNYSNALASATYDSQVITIKNVYLNNVTVQSQLSETLIGVAAGYVNASVSGVGVKDSRVTILSGTTALSGGPTSNLSDYATIGYAETNYKAERKINTTELRTPSTANASFSAQQSGSLNSWGGSIDMSALYTRLRAFQTDTTIGTTLSAGVKSETYTVNGDGTTSLASSTNYTGSFKEYYDSANPLKGSYSFSLRSDDATAYVYLYGKKQLTKQSTRKTYTSYKLYSGSNYLSTSGTSLVNATSSSAATNWCLGTSGSAGSLYTYVNGTKYYLVGNRSTYALSLSTSAPSGTTSYSNWTYSTTQYYFSRNGTSYYLAYNNGWIVRTTSSSVSRTQATTASTSTETVVNGVTTRDTYFPLNVDENNLPKDTNTGYVIGGSNFENTDYPYRSGDIRVSQYAMSSISTALCGSTTFSNSSLEVITRTASSNGFVRILDDNNSSASSSTIISGLGTNSKLSYTALGLQKYRNSRSALGTLLGSSSYIYGLHFMNSTIGMDNLVTADAVRVKRYGTDTTDFTAYQLPRDSIDFGLRKKGFINFFSGTYFSGNDSFFSLHEVSRSADYKTITGIKEISKIYASSTLSKDYIYLYSDGTYSSSLTSDYSLAFDASWIKAPTEIDGCVYYFEIPVNSGEYALGSVTGGTGAYLVYLDISANAQIVNRTAITDYVVMSIATYEYPLGLEVVGATSDAIDALNSVAIALNSGFSGTLEFARTANTVTLTSSSNAFSPGFKGDAISLARSSGDPPSVTPKSTQTRSFQRLTYIDYNTATDETTTTVFTNDGSTTSAQVTVVDSAGNATTSTATEYYDNTGALQTIASDGTPTIDVSGLNGNSLSYWYSYSAADDTISFSFALTSAYQTTTFENATFRAYSVTGYTFTLGSTTDALSVTITLANGSFVLTLNGITLAVGTVVSVAASGA